MARLKLTPAVHLPIHERWHPEQFEGVVKAIKEAEGRKD
jgi:hypothetical protein